MPIYEYRCESCDTVSEKLVRNGKEPTACPECGEEALKRLISRAGIIFKGSGFYVTDSKSGSSAASTGSTSKTEASSDKSDSSSSSGDSSTKSESTGGSTSSEKSSSSAAGGD